MPIVWLSRPLDAPLLRLLAHARRDREPCAVGVGVGCRLGESGRATVEPDAPVCHVSGCTACHVSGCTSRLKCKYQSKSLGVVNSGERAPAAYSLGDVAIHDRVVHRVLARAAAEPDRRV